MRNYQIMRYLLIVCWIIGNMPSGWAAEGGSTYTQRPDDPEAFYFTPENYGFKADGKSDVTDALQEAINQVKREKNFGILFLPEGNYRISKTIQIPSSIRLIGYGKKRPVIYLGADTPGFQTTQNYMIWFTGGLAQEGRKPSDAGAGTFYSAVSNVDFRIDKGNPQAVAIRAHFAQHGFINHCDIRIGSGKAGMYDVGNELEDVRFYGGEYGIISSRTSPGWPMMMVDTYFEGQRKAAVYSKEVGFAIVNMHVKNTSSPEPSSVADAYNNMAKIYHKIGRASDAYPMLQRFIELSDTIRKYRHTEEAIALQELYKHEQLSVENLYWRTRAAERQRNVYWMTTISLLLVWVASAVYFIYRRNRNRLMAQQHQLVQQEKELKQQRKATSESLRRMVEMEQKEARLKETFFRRLSQKVVQELEKGGNVILSDEDWDDIVQNADIIFDNFTKRLQQTYPSLNKDDLRYCCMVKMQLSQSSMAQVMHLERDSVKKRLKRIRMEKMGADSGVTLEELLYNF